MYIECKHDWRNEKEGREVVLYGIDVSSTINTSVEPRCRLRRGNKVNRLNTVLEGSMSLRLETSGAQDGERDS